MYSFMVRGFHDPNKIALSYYGKLISARNFVKDIDIFAEVISNQFGLKAGDVVSMNLPNVPNAVILFYAFNKCGVIVNLIHPLLPITEAVKSLQDSKSRLFVTLDTFFLENKKEIKKLAIPIITVNISDYLPLYKKLIYNLKNHITTDRKITYQYLRRHNFKNKVSNIESEQTAVYMHSGGTTGHPQTVVLSNQAINSLSDSLTTEIKNPGNYNKAIMVLPMFHGFGFGVCMHTMLSHGFEVALMPKFNTHEFAKIVYKRKITICAGVPLMYSKLLNLRDREFRKLKSLENVFVGGDKLDNNLRDRFNERMKSLGSKAKMREGYGLTETVTVCTVQSENDGDASVGHPLKNIKIVIVNDNNEILKAGQIGEICVTGPTLMSGYLNNLNSWFYLGKEKYIKSGDLGYIDNEGRLFFLDRKKNVFKVSGVSVFPYEIENISKGILGVDAAKVIFSNNQIHLFIQSKGIDVDYVFSVLKERLIQYALPKKEHIYLLNQFPRTTIGKIDIAELEKMIQMKEKE